MSGSYSQHVKSNIQTLFKQNLTFECAQLVKMHSIHLDNLSLNNCSLLVINELCNYRDVIILYLFQSSSINY